MKTTLTLVTVSGLSMDVTGINYRFENGIHYLSDGSYPDEIVDDVSHEKEPCK